MKKLKFPRSQWRWAGPEESLFTLDKFALAVFVQLCEEASHG
jgi:hypothetical protein